MNEGREKSCESEIEEAHLGEEQRKMRYCIRQLKKPKSESMLDVTEANARSGKQVNDRQE